MWGYPVPVLGAISPFLEPFRGRLSPNIDNVSEKMTLRYPHEGPWVVRTSRLRYDGGGEGEGLILSYPTQLVVTHRGRGLNLSNPTGVGAQTVVPHRGERAQAAAPHRGEGSNWRTPPGWGLNLSNPTQPVLTHRGRGLNLSYPTGGRG